ncbi:hypothetical protein BC936DRAFT_136827 [Jimgerdemannia flammicorona]|uniref:AAA-ATPase-like domain-containing protein n=1 Tax=Jimgerdemannia flammicorona TaxID=994334 RepID=A0A433CYP3_9FUNG|nr:hypothetical protein BC936DRAFT_136827 [Jimgerdemannia flammicorona]
MVLNKDGFQGFPVNDTSNYNDLRTNPKECATLRTTTPVWKVTDTQHAGPLPRSAGLDVDKDVKAGKLTPGQYFILTLNFAKINRSDDLKVATASLNQMVNSAVERFYKTYAKYLDCGTSEMLIKSHVVDDCTNSFEDCIFLVNEVLEATKGTHHPLANINGIYLLVDEYDAFSNEYLRLDDHVTSWKNIHNEHSLLKFIWICVKANKGIRQIAKTFITGVTPLSLADQTSGFNIAMNVSNDPLLSGLCGLSREDVLAALNLRDVCGFNDEEVKKHFDEMERYFNGYRFAPNAGIPRVFNTNTSLEYLQTLIYKRWTPSPSYPSNSEVSERTLQLLATSPVITSILEEASRNLTPDKNIMSFMIPYEKLDNEFRFADLMNTKDNVSTWLSFMRYMGGLTYADEMPEKHLQFPNLIALQRLGAAVLNRYDLRESDITGALQKIASTGDISELLACYQRMMSKRDVFFKDFQKSEEHHRDSICYAILKNPILMVHPEERNDFVLEAPITGRALINEIKVVKIDLIDIPCTEQQPTLAQNDVFLKALTLSKISNVETILNLTFPRYDKIHKPGGRLRDWITEQKAQLEEYWMSTEMEELRIRRRYVTANLIVIVGSRKILLLRLSEDGQELGEPQLVAY